MTTANAPATTAPAESTVTQFDADNGGLQITDSSKMFAMAKFFAGSELVPQCYQGKPANIIVAWQKGAELGLSPTQALDGIAVINGRASVWGEAATALVLASSLCEQHSISYHGEGDNLTARCTVKRKHMSPESFEFSVADAKQAGLWGKNTWKSYPKDMLGWKAKARAYRSLFADCLKGIMIREDMEGNGAYGGRVIEGSPSSSLNDALGVAPPVNDTTDEPDIIDAQPGEWGGDMPDEAPEAEASAWQQVVQQLADTCDCTIDAATDKIVSFVGRIYKADVSELTDQQLTDIASKIKSGDIVV